MRRERRKGEEVRWKRRPMNMSCGRVEERQVGKRK
jgi:hypothetical protein